MKTATMELRLTPLTQDPDNPNRSYADLEGMCTKLYEDGQEIDSVFLNKKEWFQWKRELDEAHQELTKQRRDKTITETEYYIKQFELAKSYRNQLDELNQINN